MIDVQNGVVAGTYGRDAVVANIGELVDRARERDVPVVWVQHHDDHLSRETDEWQIVPELARDSAESLVEKSYADAFEETQLESVLSDLGVGRLFVVGAQTDECVRSTLHGAVVRGYDATLVSDAHTTEDLSEWGAPPPDKVVAHTNLYWAQPSRAGTHGRHRRHEGGRLRRTRLTRSVPASCEAAAIPMLAFTRRRRTGHGPAGAARVRSSECHPAGTDRRVPPSRPAPDSCSSR